VRALAARRLALVLPVVADVWAALRARFRDSSASDSHASVRKVLELVRLLVAVDSRFLLSRFRDELWPALRVVVHAERVRLR
jgi:hypothetical protein